jgi:hypothetical protein
MSILKVCLRAPEGKKEEFLGSKCLFSISMGMHKILMQGKCLEETIKIINSTFSFCEIVVSDALQRFNVLAEDPQSSEEEAFIKAVSIGNKWLTSQMHLITALEIPYKISRWNDWITTNFYTEKYQFVTALFESDATFQSLVQLSAEKYFKRQKLSQSEQYIADLNRRLFASRFILEEAAVMLLWYDRGYDFELHPSPRNEALVYVHQKYHAEKLGAPKLKQSRIKVLGEASLY